MSDSSWLAKHRRTLLICLSVSAVTSAGVAYWWVLSSSKAAGGDGKKVKKVKKSRAGDLTVQDDEDALNNSVQDKAENTAAQNTAAVAQNTAAENNAQNNAQNKASPQDFKSAGNKAYLEEDYIRAIGEYTSALALQRDAVFFCNRAACHEKLGNHAETIKDCDSALEIDPSYIKAINRRLKARQTIGDYEGAAFDATAITLLTPINDPAMEARAESSMRNLSIVSEARAKELLATREPRLPSAGVVRTKLELFRPRPRPKAPSKQQQKEGDHVVILGLDAIDAQNYIHGFTLINDVLQVPQNVSKSLITDAYQARAMFKYLTGDIIGAITDLKTGLESNPKHVASLVKLGLFCWLTGDPAGKDAAFQQAIAADDQDADIHFHLAQIFMSLGDIDKATDEYKMAIALEPKFFYAEVQLACVYHADGKSSLSEERFKSLITRYPQRADTHVFYSQLLMEEKRYAEALKHVDKACDMERTKSIPNVSCFVLKAQLLRSAHKKPEEAIAMCKEAIALDPQASEPFEKLARLMRDAGKHEEAAEAYKSCIENARTTPELDVALFWDTQAKCHQKIAKVLPHLDAKLRQASLELP